MLKLCDRTFGLELEFGNVKRAEVDLPAGYGWSPDERSIVNSNATKSTPTGDFGGELNTRPLQPSLSDVREVKSVIRKCFNAGGVLMWNTGFDGHLYIGDLELDDLKKIFALGFYVSPLLNKMFKLGEWFNEPHLVPSPTILFYNRIIEAKTIEGLRNVFSNSSNTGHFRFQINLMSFFKTGTLEFRIFNSSENFRDTLETIKFMYSFLDYALTKDIKDFQAIETEEDFIREFNITREFPDKTHPLIFASSVKNAGSNLEQAFPISGKEKQAILSVCKKDKVSLVNPMLYGLELSFYEKKEVEIYNVSEFNKIIELVAKGLILTYQDEFEIFNSHRDGSTETEIVLLMVFKSCHTHITRKVKGKESYAEREFLAIVDKIEESKEKIHDYANKIIDMFSKVKIHDDLSILRKGARDDTDIVFQQDFIDGHACRALRKFSDYDYEHITEGRFDFNKVRDDLIVVSRNEHLNKRKIFKTDTEKSVFIYGTNDMEVVGLKADLKERNIGFKTPEDDFKITKKTKISVVYISQVEFTEMRAKYIKKVHVGDKRARPVVSFAVMSEDIVLGSFGFEYVENEDMKNYSLVLSSDFCTNNNVKLLSKFILFMIKTKEVKKMIERRLIERVYSGYTHVYTTMPVSMKYRGAFKKISGNGKKLTYGFDFGSTGTIKVAKREYINRSNK